MLRRSSVAARALAVALAVLSLGAPWFASWGACRESSCTQQGALTLASTDFAASGAASCPCPASCESEKTRGCGQACGGERDSLSVSQPMRVRRGGAEPSSQALVANPNFEIAFDTRALRRSASGPSSSGPTSAPLFIKHRSIIR